jgi:Domain of Unknown Function (DUF1080)
MKRWATLLSALLTVCGVALLLSQTSQYAAAANHAGWVMLFDGNNLDDWNKIGTANWKLDEDGIVAADSGNGFLVSKNSYKDFELRVEFWLEPRTNSGVFIRCTDPQKISSQTAYEINIFDKRPDAAYGTGGIPGVAKAAVAMKAGGKWNLYEIVAKGPRFTVTLNGTRTVDGAEDGKFPSGRVALQYGQGVVKFRKVEVRPL